MTNFPMTLGAAPLQAVLGDHAFVSSYSRTWSSPATSRLRVTRPGYLHLAPISRSIRMRLNPGYPTTAIAPILNFAMPTG